MASSVREQDEPNPALGLTTREDKMAMPCRSGLPAVDSVLIPYNKSFIDHPCSVKMVGY